MSEFQDTMNINDELNHFLKGFVAVLFFDQNVFFQSIASLSSLSAKINDQVLAKEESRQELFISSTKELYKSYNASCCLQRWWRTVRMKRRWRKFFERKRSCLRLFLVIFGSFFFHPISHISYIYHIY